MWVISEKHEMGGQFTLSRLYTCYGKPTTCSKALLGELAVSASQEIPRIYRTMKFVTVSTTAPPLELILSQKNPVHVAYCFLDVIFNIILPFTPRCSTFPRRNPVPTFTISILGEGYKSSLHDILQCSPPRYFHPHRTRYRPIPRTLFPNYSAPVLLMWQTVPQPYKMGKTKVLHLLLFWGF